MSKIISEEILKKIRSASSVQELINIADRVGVELSREDATKYFNLLQQQKGELSDGDLDNVTGGLLHLFEQKFKKL